MASDPQNSFRRGKYLAGVVSAAQMKMLDQRAIHVLGIPSLCLMENAGRAVAEECWRLLSRSKNSGRKVVIVCGQGNNGADGLVAARHLFNRGCRVCVWIVGENSHPSDEFVMHCRVTGKLGIPVEQIKGSRRLQMSGVCLVVDALFGVGLSRPLEGDYLRTVEAINQARVPVISIDVPSGIDATTGRVLGACVKASLTVALAFPKKGLFIGDGPRFSGKVLVADIGMPGFMRGRKA